MAQKVDKSESPQKQEEVREEKIGILHYGARKSGNREKCRYTSLDILEEANIAVCVSDVGQSRVLSYKVGKYDSKNDHLIEWEDTQPYDKGRFPSVALISGNTNIYAVEVHNLDFSQQLFYRTGNVTTKTITWGNNNFAQRIGDGKKPTISTTGNKIVLVYEDASILHLHSMKYRIGTLQLVGVSNGENSRSSVQVEKGDVALSSVATSLEIAESSNIHWEDEVPISVAKGVEPSVSVDGTTVALAYRDGVLSRDIKVVIGTLEGKRITWSTTSEKCDGGWNPTVSINHSKYVVVMYQGIARKMWHAAGIIKGNKVQWNKDRIGCPGDGEYPTIYLLSNNNIVVIHKANFTHSLYQSEGELKHLNKD